MRSGLQSMLWPRARRAGRQVKAAVLMPVLALAAAIGLGACASGNSITNPLLGQQPSQDRAAELEPMLQAAGFTSMPASTADQDQRLKGLPQLKLGYYVDRRGNANYWLADADNCRCLFHGDEAAYQRYENIKLENQVAERDRQTIEAQQRQQMMGQPGFGPPGFGGPGGFGLSFGGGGFGFSF
jgi:hypothetical protein